MLYGRWRPHFLLELKYMTYAAGQNAVCFEDLKTAALYFDSVIPIAFQSMQGRGKGSDVLFRLPEEIPGEILVNLVFNVSPRSNAEKWTHLGRYIDAWDAFIKAIHPARDRFPHSYEDVKRIYLADSAVGDSSTVRQEFKKLAAALGNNYSTVLLPSEESAAEETPYAVLAISGVPLVDASKASWEQIVELRKDPDARRKLRNLRLFLHGVYQEKPREFIEDDLGRRIDEYNSARQRLGFEAVAGTISSLLDAKNLHAATATGIAAALAGGAITGIGSAVLVELGGMALEFSKKRFAIKQFENSHELAYLIRAKKALA